MSWYSSHIPTYKLMCCMLCQFWPFADRIFDLKLKPLHGSLFWLQIHWWILQLMHAIKAYCRSQQLICYFPPIRLQLSASLPPLLWKNIQASKNPAHPPRTARRHCQKVRIWFQPQALSEHQWKWEFVRNFSFLPDKRLRIRSMCCSVWVRTADNIASGNTLSEMYMIPLHLR